MIILIILDKFNKNCTNLQIMLNFYFILPALFTFLVCLCMIEFMYNCIIFSANSDVFYNTNIKLLFELVRKNARDGQKKEDFSGKKYFQIIKKAIPEKITINSVEWILWTPNWLQTIIYKLLEFVETVFRTIDLTTAGNITHFILQLFRIQCVYDFKYMTKKDSIIRILQIALNLGQLEGQLGIIFPFQINSFVTSKLIKINQFKMALIVATIKNYKDSKL